MFMVTIKDSILIEINKGKKKNIFKSLATIYMSPSNHALFLYRLSKSLYDNGHKVFAKLIKNRLIKLYGLHVSLKAQIGIGINFKHINGVVIGDGVVIGKNVVIYHQVTLGGQNLGDGKEGNYPVIEDNVTIFTGAKILGPVRIGENSIIGANSVIVKDVPQNCIVAGVPGKVIK